MKTLEEFSQLLVQYSVDVSKEIDSIVGGEDIAFSLVVFAPTGAAIVSNTDDAGTPEGLKRYLEILGEPKLEEVVREH